MRITVGAINTPDHWAKRRLIIPPRRPAAAIAWIRRRGCDLVGGSEGNPALRKRVAHTRWLRQRWVRPSEPVRKKLGITQLYVPGDAGWHPTARRNLRTRVFDGRWARRGGRLLTHPVTAYATRDGRHGLVHAHFHNVRLKLDAKHNQAALHAQEAYYSAIADAGWPVVVTCDPNNGTADDYYRRHGWGVVHFPGEVGFIAYKRMRLIRHGRDHVRWSDHDALWATFQLLPLPTQSIGGRRHPAHIPALPDNLKETR